MLRNPMFLILPSILQCFLVSSFHCVSDFAQGRCLVGGYHHSFFDDCSQVRFTNENDNFGHQRWSVWDTVLFFFFSSPFPLSFPLSFPPPSLSFSFPCMYSFFSFSLSSLMWILWSRCEASAWKNDKRKKTITCRTTIWNGSFYKTPNGSDL